MKKKNKSSIPKTTTIYSGLMAGRFPEGTPESEQLTIMQYELKKLSTSNKTALKKKIQELNERLTRENKCK